MVDDVDDDGNGSVDDNDVCNDDGNFEHMIVMMMARLMMLVMLMAMLIA